MIDIPVTDLQHETLSTLDGAERFIMYDAQAGKTISLFEILTYILQNVQFADPSNDGNIIITIDTED